MHMERKSTNPLLPEQKKRQSPEAEVPPIPYLVYPENGKEEPAFFLKARWRMPDGRKASLSLILYVEQPASLQHQQRGEEAPCCV